MWSVTIEQGYGQYQKDSKLAHLKVPHITHGCAINYLLTTLDLKLLFLMFLRWFSDKACWNVTTIEETVSTASTLEVNEPKRVSVGMFWSPLVVMILGVILSFIVAVAEIFWYKYRGRVSCLYIHICIWQLFRLSQSDL